jgi:hypothetical protein
VRSSVRLIRGCAGLAGEKNEVGVGYGDRREIWVRDRKEEEETKSFKGTTRRLHD